MWCCDDKSLKCLPSQNVQEKTNPPPPSPLSLSSSAASVSITSPFPRQHQHSPAMPPGHTHTAPSFVTAASPSDDMAGTPSQHIILDDDLIPSPCRVESWHRPSCNALTVPLLHYRVSAAVPPITCQHSHRSHHTTACSPTRSTLLLLLVMQSHPSTCAGMATDHCRHCWCMTVTKAPHTVHHQMMPFTHTHTHTQALRAVCV